MKSADQKVMQKEDAVISLQLEKAAELKELKVCVNNSDTFV